MLGKNQIKIQIEPDGTLKVETGDMGGVNHQSADQLLQELARLMGGAVVSGKVETGHHHHHHHDHSHDHEGGGHHH